MRRFTIAANFASLICLLLVEMSLAGGVPLKISGQQINETRQTHEIKFSYPRTGHPTIDQGIQSWVRGLARDFAKEATEAHDRMKWDAELTYEVPRNDGDALSLIFSYYSFTGGAHPITTFHTFHFLLPDGYGADFAEIFSPRGVKRVSDISIARLRRMLAGPDGMSDADWVRRGAAPNARNFTNFVLKLDELVIYFDPYQVAAYAAGAQEVHIPVSQLRDTMRPDVRAPSASFDCGIARSDIEQVICTSRELAKLDRLLGEAYADRLIWMDEGVKRRSFRQTQRDWLKVRDSSCRAARESAVACLTTVYAKRLKELTAEP